MIISDNIIDSLLFFLAILTGDDAAFKYAIHTTVINPYIGCIIRSLMSNILKAVVFEYTAETLDRILKFIMAIVRNSQTREADFNDQLFHLSQIMVCLILGPLDLNIGLAQLKKQEEEYKQREEQINLIAKQLQNNKDEEATTTLFPTEQLQNIKEEATTTPYPAMDLFECEALLQVMESDGFEPQIENDFKGNKIKQEINESKMIGIKVIID